ncbi:MAG: hypothetical protein Q4G71_15885, partial [Pseudomonadota bacterium]|nr:hypothetical protein [Pseudomonadota bacterium]
MSAISSLPAATELLGAASGGNLQAGYNVSLTDMSGFADAMARAQGGGSHTLGPQAVTGPSESMQALFKPLERINAE